METVLIIEQTPSYLMSSLKAKLVAAGYEVVTEKSSVDAVSKWKGKISAILIYADEELVENTGSLNYIKDRAQEEDISIFVIASPEELKSITAMIPVHLIAKSFMRPVNVNEVSETMVDYMEKYSNANKKTILVVDDSGAMLRNVKGWLEAEYQVALANSGAMAIKYLATNRPDLILLDYEMPILDGRQVLEMIRSEEDFAGIPVIFLTSKNDKESIMKVMALKPEGYLLKTMEPDLIVQNIRDFFEKRKMMNMQ